MGHRYLKSGTAGTASPYESDTTAATGLGTLTALTLAVDEVIWVSQAHTQGGNATFNASSNATPSSPQRLLCVSDFDASPGTLAQMTGSGFVPGSTASNNFNGHWYIYGVLFDARYVLTSSASINFGTGNSPSHIELVSCRFQAGGGSATGVTFGSSGSSANDDCYFKIVDCHWQVSSTIATFTFGHGRTEITNLTIGNVVTFPTSLFSIGGSGRATDLLIENSDLTGFAWTYLFTITASSIFRVIVRNCKFPSGWIGYTGTLQPGCSIAIDNCDDGNTNYIHRRYAYAGSVREEPTVYATTNPASDGITSISWKMVSLGTCSIFEPLYSEWIYVWVDSTSTAITPAVEVLVGADGAAALKNTELWVEVDAMDTASTPLGTRKTNRIAQVIDSGVDQNAGTVAWTGDGYTTERTHKLSVTSFTPDQKGYIRVRVALAKASTTIYVNPRIALS